MTRWGKSATGRMMHLNKNGSSLYSTDVYFEMIKNLIIWWCPKLWRFWWRTVVRGRNTDVDLLKTKKNLNKVLLLKQTSSVWGIKEKITSNDTKKRTLRHYTVHWRQAIYSLESIHPHRCVCVIVKSPIQRWRQLARAVITSPVLFPRGLILPGKMQSVSELCHLFYKNTSSQ